MHIDLNSLDWEDTRPGFIEDALCPRTAEAPIDGDTAYLIVAASFDGHGGASSGMALDVGNKSYDTNSTQDWPTFDRLFGRAEWQAFVAKHEQDAQRFLEEADEYCGEEA